MFYEFHCPRCGAVRDYVSQRVEGRMHYYENVMLNVEREELEFDNYESDYDLDDTNGAVVTFSCDECGCEFWSGPYNEAYNQLKRMMMDGDPNKRQNVLSVGS